ncbi:hypothetical protein QYE76_067991 [Lolium multiflorum]|uniref:Phylloplanin n=1 Tax=Lolium multiflorum TaxID=4521 RepID=A0AAD8SEY5_LOLMU|nr:phylloplanin-like [Lolium perenne]KAK1650186.1 hypothetical protein QYE76_067991 [Lolium multiflorum]
MATKSLFLSALLLVAVGMAPHGAEADTQLPLGIISGIVPCSAGSSINVAAVPVFPNAAVQVVCGGTVVGAAKTDDSGAFTINLRMLSTQLLTSLLQKECKVVVVTPLAACNVSLASVTGTLAATVQILGADSGSSGLGGLGGLGGLIGLIGQIIGGVVGGVLNIATAPFSVI